MGKKKPSAPETPDPVKTAAAQAAANKEGAISSQEMSMVNQITPQGSLNYEQTGTSEAGNPTYTATQTYSPDQQAIYDLGNQASQQYGQTALNQLGNVSAQLSKPIDYSSLGPAPEINEATRTASRDAIIQRLSPQLNQDKAALETQLANQGFMTGTEGYNNAMDQYNRQRNDAFLAADAQGGNEMARLYGLESSVRDRGINELIQQRQVPLNELAAMMSGSQVQGPQFVNAPGAQVAAAPIAESIYGSANLAQQNYAQQMAARNASTEGLYGLGSAGMGALGQWAGGGFKFSDRRLKRNIERIGTLDNGLPVYRYDYIWGGPRQTGLMADEVKILHPEAVKNVGGYDAVNYAEAIR